MVADDLQDPRKTARWHNIWLGCSVFWFLTAAVFAGVFGGYYSAWHALDECAHQRIVEDGPFDPSKHCMTHQPKVGLVAVPGATCQNHCDQRLYDAHIRKQDGRRLQTLDNDDTLSSNLNGVSSGMYISGYTLSYTQVDYSAGTVSTTTDSIYISISTAKKHIPNAEFNYFFKTCGEMFIPMAPSGTDYTDYFTLMDDNSASIDKMIRAIQSLFTDVSEKTLCTDDTTLEQAYTSTNAYTYSPNAPQFVVIVSEYSKILTDVLFKPPGITFGYCEQDTLFNTQLNNFMERVSEHERTYNTRKHIKIFIVAGVLKFMLQHYIDDKQTLFEFLVGDMKKNGVGGLLKQSDDGKFHMRILCPSDYMN